MTRMDIQKLYRKLKHEGRVHGHPEHGHELSDTMVLRIHAMLHQCLKDAEAAHVVARNPTDGAVVPKASYKPKQILTKEQMDTSVVEVLRQYRETVDSRWMFPSPVKEDVPLTPGAVRRRLQIILERAGCKRIRFHDLRHPYVKLTTKNKSLQKQKSQATN